MFLSVQCTALQHWREYRITWRVRSPVSDVRSECEKLRMAITQQRVIRSTSCLVLGWAFSEDRLALFNLTAQCSRVTRTLI